MKTLNIENMPVTAKTITSIQNFVYHNRNQMGNYLKLFYSDVAGLIKIQLRKSLSRRMNMAEILERAYNIDQYVLDSGACSIETHFA